MGDDNFLAAYKLINAQLVQSNQKLKEEIKEKVELINSLNEDLFQYRMENKTLRDMVQKLLEQFKMVTTIMGSVRDQSESVFNKVFNEHAKKEQEQQMRRPVAGLFYEKRRAERPPYEDEAAIDEVEDENRSMEDYRTAIQEDDDVDEELLEEEDEVEEESSTPSKSPLVKRLGRKSRNRSFDESFETIDTNRVVKAVRKSQEYLLRRDSRDGRRSDDESLQEKSESKMEIDASSVTIQAPAITINATTVTNATKDQPTVGNSSIIETSSICTNSDVDLSDQTTKSEMNPVTDQSLRPVSMKRMASDSMLTTLIERDTNKENSFINNDTISNAASSTPVAKKGRSKKPKCSYPQGLSGLSPVPVFVALKPLTKQNLNEHNISYEALMQANGNLKKVKKEEQDSFSDQNSIDSNESGRPRRKAAPTMLKERKINTKLRRT